MRAGGDELVSRDIVWWPIETCSDRSTVAYQDLSADTPLQQDTRNPGFFFECIVAVFVTVADGPFGLPKDTIVGVRGEVIKCVEIEWHDSIHCYFSLLFTPTFRPSQ